MYILADRKERKKKTKKDHTTSISKRLFKIRHYDVIGMLL